jgi:membrane-associated phospholipid phosphatase
MQRMYSAPSGWWAVDKVVLAYMLLTGVLIAVCYRAVPYAAALLLAKVLGALLIALAVRFPHRLGLLFHHWYPLPYVGACYKEMAILIPAIRRSDADRWLADLDYAFWGANPTVWLERIQSRSLTEVLQILYSLFVPAVLVIAFVLWHRRRYAEFRVYAFLIALGFLASYLGYFLVPARGPRFLLAHLQHTRLEGLWLFYGLQSGLDRLESAHYDCFPSGHTELTILAWWSSRVFSRRIFAAYFVYTLGIIFATVYLRYHYTIDLLAGMVLAAILIAAAPVLYRRLQKGN